MKYGFSLLISLLFFNQFVFCQHVPSRSEIERMKAEALKKYGNMKLPVNNFQEKKVEKKSLRITAVRTVEGNMNVTSNPGDGCVESKSGHSLLRIEWNLSADSVVVRDDPDLFEFQVEGKQMTNGSTPLKGTGKVNYENSEEEKSSCGGSGNSNSKATALGNLPETSFSFSYDPIKDDGDFNFDAQYNEATGTGNLHSQDKGNPPIDMDISKLAAGQANLFDNTFGHFSARNKLLIAPGQTTQAAEQLQNSLDATGMGGFCTISKQGGDYIIIYNYSKTIDTKEKGWEGTSTLTINTQVRIAVLGKQKQYDAIIEPFAIGNASGDYKKWIPEGPKIDVNDKLTTSKGNSISFRVYIIDKANPDKPDPNVKYSVIYSLIQGSKEPGYCNNFPLTGADQDWDLRFDSLMKGMSGTGFFSKTVVKSIDLRGRNVMPVITSYDYGSFAKLKTEITLENGIQLLAHLKIDTATEIPIPIDKNDNQIADEWEKENGVSGLNDAWDEEESPKNYHNGDGLTLYEEYRGIMAKGKFIRLDPHKKELFVLNHIGDAAQPGFNLFQSASGIKVIELSDKDIDKYDLVVNVNSVFAKLGKQHALLLKDYHPLGANIQGYTPNRADNGNIPTSPGDCQFVGINLSYPFKGNDMAVTIAHEMAHGCGVLHHGNMPSLIAPSKNAIDNSYQFYGNNMLPVSPELIKNQGLLGDIAGPGSQSSGDMYCIMCYSDVFVWAAPKGTEGKIYINVDGNADDCPKTKFCDSNKGTFLNDPNHKPYPVYGDAANGGCIHQFQVKDWH